MKTSALAMLVAISSFSAWAAGPSGPAHETNVSVTDASLILSGVRASRVRHLGVHTRMLTAFPPSPTDDATFAMIRGITAQDFVVEAMLKGVPIDSTSTARGFVGIAFRISDNLSRFEAIYLRPTNARAEDQIRRNHTTQYISHPGYPWERFRAEHPGQYESYTDLNANGWTKVRLVVSGSRARLYINDAPEAALIVNDLKLPPESGGIGLWVGPGSKAYFKSLKITVDRPSCIS